MKEASKHVRASPREKLNERKPRLLLDSGPITELMIRLIRGPSFQNSLEINGTIGTIPTPKLEYKLKDLKRRSFTATQPWLLAKTADS